MTLGYTLVGIGTVLAGIGAVITSVVGIKTLRVSRGVKTDLAENTALTNDVHDAVTKEGS
jgi:hypothetical protein